MLLLFLKAYCKLIRFDMGITRGGFDGLHSRIRNFPLHTKAPPGDVIGRICSAVDTACIWYWKEVLCLERSAVTTCLLRQHGVAAKLVIGAQQKPFRAHAWVEVDGRVVNDKPYVPEMYRVLDRC